MRAAEAGAAFLPKGASSESESESAGVCGSFFAEPAPLLTRPLEGLRVRGTSESESSESSFFTETGLRLYEPFEPPFDSLFGRFA